MMTAEQFARLARREHITPTDYDQFLAFADNHCTPRMLRELLDGYPHLHPHLRRLAVKLLARKIAQGALAMPHCSTTRDRVYPPH